MTIKGTVRGKSIEFSSPLPYPDGQEVTIQVVVSANGNPVGSPSALLSAIRKSPRVDPTIIDEWERAIHEGKVAAQFRGTFDNDLSQ